METGLNAANERAREAASLLFDAHRSGTRMTELPHALAPATIGEAYAIQTSQIERFGGRVGGWKTSVGRAVDVCSPIPAERFFHSPADLSGLAMLEPRLEVELALLLGESMPARATPYTSSDASSAVDRVVLAMEIATSRFADRTAVSPLSVIADLQNNEAVVWGSGAKLSDCGDLANFQAQLLIDGLPALEAVPREQHSTAQVMHSLAWLANHAAARGFPLQAGDVVLTGARLMPVRVAKGSVAELKVASMGSISSRF